MVVWLRCGGDGGVGGGAHGVGGGGGGGVGGGVVIVVACVVCLRAVMFEYASGRLFEFVCYLVFCVSCLFVVLCMLRDCVVVVVV